MGLDNDSINISQRFAIPALSGARERSELDYSLGDTLKRHPRYAVFTETPRRVPKNTSEGALEARGRVYKRFLRGSGRFSRHACLSEAYDSESRRPPSRSLSRPSRRARPLSPPTPSMPAHHGPTARLPRRAPARRTLVRTSLQPSLPALRCLCAMGTLSECKLIPPFGLRRTMVRD